MATVQQLEKLHSIKRAFQGEETLESAVVCQRIDKIIARTEHLLHQRSFLREERRKLRSACEYLDAAQKSVEIMKRPDWLTVPDATPKEPGDSVGGDKAAAPVTAPPTVKINMSGLMFEVSVDILQRDKGSILAQLAPYEPTRGRGRGKVGVAGSSSSGCGSAAADMGGGGGGGGDGGEDSDAQADCTEGVHFMERDWWLFRYVLAFLRDGTLPAETPLLVALYREAAYYGLGELQRAVEDRKLHLHDAPADKGDKGDGKDKDKDKDKGKTPPAPWWQSVPSWLRAVDAVEAAAKKERDSRVKPQDWWVDTTYNGKNFAK